MSAGVSQPSAPAVRAAAVGARLRRLWRALLRFDAAFPIAIKLALPILAVLVSAGVLLAWLLYQQEADRIRADFEKRALITVRSVEEGLASHPFIQSDEEWLAEVQRHIDGVARADESILLVNVYGFRDGSPAVIASSDANLIGAPEMASEARKHLETLSAGSPTFVEEEAAGEKALDVGLPFNVAGRTLAMCVYLPTAERDAALAALLRTLVVGTGGGLALVVVALFLTLRLLIFGRLRRLLAATKRVQVGDYAARVDCVGQPGARDEMLCLCSSFNAMAEAIQTLHRQLEEQATTDPLTELYNRRYLIEVLEREVQRARRQNEPLSVILLDVDSLKEVNDRYGHAAGDAVLLSVAQVLRRALRRSDVSARFGGDEFLVLLPGCDADGLAALLERIRGDVERLGTGQTSDGPPVELTVSAGGALLRPGDTPDTLIQRADAALYEAKRAGGNQARLAA